VIRLLLAAALTVCPEAAGLERSEQQRSACTLAQRRPAAPDRAMLERVLAEPEFARATDRNANVLTILRERFFAWLQHLFQTHEAAAFAHAAPFAVLTVAFAVALLAMLRFARLGRRRAGAVEASLVPAGPLGLKRAPQHLANARALLAGAPRDAIREALLALLSALEQRRLARPDRVKTNRELCSELLGRGAEPTLVERVGAQLSWYDRAFYSLATVSAGDARIFIDEVERLMTMTPMTPPP
jgi:hypothetical protein